MLRRLLHRRRRIEERTNRRGQSIRFYPIRTTCRPRYGSSRHSNGHIRFRIESKGELIDIIARHTPPSPSERCGRNRQRGPGGNGRNIDTDAQIELRGFGAVAIRHRLPRSETNRKQPSRFLPRKSECHILRPEHAALHPGQKLSQAVSMPGVDDIG